jgi:hypothetical protein
LERPGASPQRCQGDALRNGGCWNWGRWLLELGDGGCCNWAAAAARTGCLWQQEEASAAGTGRWWREQRMQQGRRWHDQRSSGVSRRSGGASRGGSGWLVGVAAG